MKCYRKYLILLLYFFTLITNFERLKNMLTIVENCITEKKVKKKLDKEFEKCL